MKISELNHYQFTSNYPIDDRNFLVAVKDPLFSDRNIIPLFYVSHTDEIILEVDENEIGKKIFVNKGTDLVTQDIETRFYPNELFKLVRGPLSPNERHEIDPNVPKKRTYKNKLDKFLVNEIIEFFDAQIDEPRSAIKIKNEDLRELIGNTYIRDQQILFVKYTSDTLLGPFQVKRRQADWFTVERSLLFGKFGIYKIPNEYFIEVEANNIQRNLIIDVNQIEKAFIEEFDFSTDEEVISWFNDELVANTNVVTADEVVIVSKILSNVAEDSEMRRSTKRYKRLVEILSKTKDLLISKQNLIAFLPELSSIRSEIEREKQRELALRNDIEEKRRELGIIEDALSAKKDDKGNIELEIENLKQKREQEQIKIKEEIEGRIYALKQEIEGLDEKLQLEREQKSNELNELKDEIAFHERTREELKRTIESLRKDFIDDQKNAQEKLVELVRHKTHFDFISGKDLSVNDSKKYEALDNTIKNKNLVSYKELKNSVSEILRQQQRFFPSHFVDNLLISVIQNTLTVFAGPPGTGKTSLAKILTQSLTDPERIREVSVARGWTSQKDLIGFSNPISKSFYESQTGLYKLLKQLDYEWENSKYMDSPLGFVILDEANLSPMEHYWSTFYNFTDSSAQPNKPMVVNLGQAEIIKYANSLRFIGTINYDQTIEELSPRILDRVNIIRLKPSISQMDNFITSDIKHVGISLSSLIEMFQLADFESSGSQNITMPDRLKEKYDEIKRVFETKLGILISPRVEIAIRRYCQLANKYMTEEYRPLDYCIAQRLLPLINIYGNKKDELEELRILINNLKLEDSVSSSIIDSIIQIGSREGFTKDNYNYFLTLTHV